MRHNYCPYCMSLIKPGEPCPSCGLTEGAYTPLSHHLPPGTVLAGRYLVGRVLGEGGFGITYIGCDLRLELKVAIKEFYPGDKVTRNNTASLSVVSYTGAVGQGYETSRARFIKEARAMARMDKTPQIVAVRDFFEENNTAYIVMEYVDGTTFKELVAQKGGKVSSKELLPLVEPLFGALSSMHKLGLIHRDISPDNLMLENGCVRLLDFGCARESDKGNATMTIVLKHGYSPIEQYQHKGQGPWTDVYSLAATLYFCLTGTTPPQALDRICDEELIPPRQLGADLTPAQEKAILTAMGVRRSQRYSSVEEFRAALFEGVGAEDSGPEDIPETALTAEVMSEQEKAPPTGDIHVSEEASASGDLPVTGEVPTDEEILADRDTSVPDQEADKPARSSRRLWPIVGGVAAAVLCMVLLLWHPWTGPSNADNPDPSASPTVTQGPEETDTLTQTNPPVPAAPAFSQDKSNEDNAAVLLALLADDSVESVAIPPNVNFTVDGSVTLTKPLQIKRYAGMTIHGSFTVAGGGSLEMAGEGSMYCDTLLRTMDGGTVSLEEGANLGFSTIWLERKDDLNAAPGAHVNYWGGGSPDPQPHEMSHRLTLDEEALFADAVHVSSGEEFSRNLRGTKPMVIDGEVTLTQPLACYVPILVPEGSMLNAPCEEGGGDCTLDVHGTTVVNHGTIRGRVSLFGSYQDLSQLPVLVNHGRIEGCFSTYEGPATLINLGEIALSASPAGTPCTNDANLTNLGAVSLECLVEMRNGWTANAGSFTVVRGGDLALHNGSWQNFDRLSLESGGALHSQGQLNLVSGRLTVGKDGELYNFGLLRVEGSGVLMGHAGSVLVNDGLVVEDGGLSVGASPFGGPGRILSLRYNSDRTRHVSSESELRAALADDRCDLVVWNGYDPSRKIDLNGGPIQLTKGLVLGGDRDNPPEFNSGGLTLSGEDAFFIGDNVNFNSNELVVEGGTVLLDGEMRRPAENITVENGGLLFLAGGAEMPNPGTLDLRGGGRFLITGNIEFGQCGVTVEQDSALWVYGYLGLIYCNVTNHGQIVTDFGDLNQTDGGSLTNYGELYLAGWQEMARLGNVTNHGQIVVAGRQRVFGTLVNEADGTIKLEWEDETLLVSGHLDNRGTIRGARGTFIETVDGGTFTGSHILYGE